MAEIKILLELLAGKYKLLQEILNFSRQQTAHIKQEEIDKLERLLESKQVRMKKIDSLDRKFIKAFERIKEEYGITDIADLDADRGHLSQLKELTSKVSEILNKIYHLDEENQSLINGQHKNLKLRLKRIHQGKRTRRSYDTQSQTGGVYLDKKN